MKTVLLVDDHALFRESLALLLLRQRLPELRVLEAGSMHVALRQCEQCPDLDLVVLDLELRDSRGLLTLERLREARPRARVIVVSGSVDASVTGEVQRLGALGFLSKAASTSELVETLRRALLLPVPHDPAEVVEPLSERQREVLERMIEGKSNKVICRELNVSEATVKTHVQAIFRKLDVNTRTQAVMAAIHHGLHVPAGGTA